MLALKCKVGESIMIGDDIMITFVGIDKGEAKLAFDAPREIAIHREKIYNRIKAGKSENDKSDHQRQPGHRDR